MKRIKRLAVGCLVWLMIVFASVVAPLPAMAEGLPVSTLSSDVARDWFALQLPLVRRTWGFSPPVAARAFGYLGVTLYESVVPGMPDYQSLSNQLNELSELPQPETGSSYHWGVVANSALATMTRSLYPTAHEANRAAIDALYQTYAARFQNEVDAATFARSVEYGQRVAAAVFEWSTTDGGHEGYKRNFPANYQPPTGAGMWEPTPRAKGEAQPAMQPTWGDNRPFVLASGIECAPPPPPPYSEEPDSAFYAEALEVYTVTSELTAEQREIARFWADDPFRTATPAGHSISILTQVLAEQNATLDIAAEAYARMGIGLSDAFISCWSAKYQYNLVRPITYIRRVIDSEWTSPLVTPPFPEYPSGHSVESSAAAAILTGLFGEDYAFTDHTHDEWGLPARSFGSFEAFAQEAALSRIYGGIHYRAAVENGLAQGACIAAKVEQIEFHA